MKTAIFYARVSTQEQAKYGYSIRQQAQALRQYAEDHNLEIVEEVADEGYSGAILERPGMDKIRDLVAAGGIDLVLAQDADRISREPWHFEYLKSLFEDYGTRLQTVDDAGDETPMGEFVRYIRRGVAKLERTDITHRTQRGRRQRVWEGKIIGGGSPPYGFQYNADKSNYVPIQGQLDVVRRIFELSASGATLNRIKKTLEKDGIPTQKGARYWHRGVIRDIILDDLYRSHTYADLKLLVDQGRMSQQVLDSIDPAGRYGLWFYGKESSPHTNGGKTKRKVSPNPEAEWLAVPTPDAGVPTELVDAARRNVSGNVRPSNAGRREWPLSGMIFCPCGYRLGVHAKVSDSKTWGYYICRRRQQNGPDACEHARFHNADRTEERVRQFALDLIKNPDTLRKNVEDQARRMKESMRNPECEAAILYRQMDRAEQDRDNLIRLFRTGRITEEEYDAHSAEIDQQKAAAERELDRLSSVQDRIQALEELPELVEGYLKDLPYLMESRRYKLVWDGEPPQRLPSGAPKPYRVGGPDDPWLHNPPKKIIDQKAEAAKWRGLYQDLGLKVIAYKDGSLEISWGLDGHNSSVIR
jgi:site-specific DNA recombinase